MKFTEMIEAEGFDLQSESFGRLVFEMGKEKKGDRSRRVSGFIAWPRGAYKSRSHM